MMRSLLTILIGFFPMLTFTQLHFDEVFTQFLDDEALAPATVGFSMVKVENRAELFSYAKGRSMVPASSLKMVTAATALEMLGNDHRFVTTLAFRGKVVDSTLFGDVVILGGGDPSLGSVWFHSGDEFMKQWLNALQQAGIHKITGDVIGDSGYFSDEPLAGSTSVADAGNYYGAGGHGLAYHDNTYIVRIKTGEQPGDACSVVDVVPAIADLSFRCEVRASESNKDNAYIYGVPGTYERVIVGELPMKQSAYEIKGSLPDPALQCAEDLTAFLRASGMGIRGAARSVKNAFPESELRILTKTYSQPLSEIVRIMLKNSVNSYADALLKHIGKKYYGEGSFTKGVRAVEDFWKERGVPVKGWYQHDGSGLSRADAITAQQLTLIIAKVSEPYRSTLEAGLKSLGDSGRIRCKSGYMDRVRSYAGYLTLSDGTQCAFTIIVNNHDCSPTEMRKKITSMLERMSQATPG
ncbi:MAG: D-alanyl-D-alanine carboxypeptidase/D-alanyl-D-alanine-endopeptidase [Flavobacteriales bacterium]|nr:D-alanyl-D-alanine carboxypeptidase/D-alanyl-D-alanine-endopeptidase [Flavobacteriales bacterium]